MKKIFLFALALLSTIAIKAKVQTEVPQVESPANGFVTIVIHIPSTTECHGIYMKGTFDDVTWSGSNTYVGLDAPNVPADQAVRFESINNSDEWYKATFKLGQTTNIGLWGKVCLKYTDDVQWQGQAVGVSVDAEHTTINYSISTEGQVLIAKTETGLLYLNIKGWGKSECAEISIRTITVRVPQCSGEDPVLVGSLNDWNMSANPMTKIQEYVYTCTVEASNYDRFKIAGSINGWDNQVLQYNESKKTWEDSEDVYLYDQTTIFVDYGDYKKYKWTKCADPYEGHDENPTATYDFEKDGCYYNIISLSDLTVELTCRSNEDKDSYREIGDYFGDFRVPETVEYSNRTFTVVSIHKNAFRNCILGTLTIPKTILGTGRLNKVLVNHLIIEDGDSELSCSFSGETSNVMNSVYLGRNMPNIFYGIVEHGGAYKTIMFGDKVTYLPNVCSENKNITDVTLSSSIKTLYRSFQGCSNLKSVSGDGVEILEDAFTNSGIESINLPNLQQINGAFQGCNSLTTMNIQEGVLLLGESTQTGKGSFTGSTALSSVTIPATVLSIAGECFAGCTALQTISVVNPDPVDIYENTFDSKTYLNATLKVPVGAKDAYMKAEHWKNFWTIEEDPSLVATKACIFITDNSVKYSIPDPKSEFDVHLGKENNQRGYTVPIGTKITFTVMPDKNDHIVSVMLNGEDVTAQVEDNKYVYTVTGNATLECTSKYISSVNMRVGDILNIQKAYQESELEIVSVNIDDESIAEYKDGNIKAIKEGKTLCKIKAKYHGHEFEDSFNINVIAPTGLENVVINGSKTKKILKDGHIYILHDGHIYNSTGQKVR